MLSFPVRAEDAFFLHAQTVSCPQQVGAVALLTGPGVDLAGLRASVAARVGQVPQLRRRLIPPRGRWDRPRWVIDPSLDVPGRVTEIICADSSLATLERVVGRYFAEPVDPAQAAWQLLLVRAAAGSPSAIVVKAHHALGDSYALIAELSGLFDGQDPRPRTARLGSPKPGGAGAPVRDGSRCQARVDGALRVARGLAGLSLAGPPGLIGADGTDPATGHHREFAAISVDARMVAIKARLLGAGMADLVLAVAAAAIGQLMAGRGQPAARATVRAMVPCSLRSAGSAGQPASRPAAPGRAAASGTRSAGAGNRTAGVLLDLPVGPMSLAERVTAVRAVRRARLRRGDAEASAFVLRAMNLLPPPLQRVIARTAFTSRRFSLIVSVFPGTRQSRRLLGAQVTEVFPVLALADGVGLALGAMTWGRSLSIGIMTDPAIIPHAGLLAAAIRDAFAAGDSGPAG
jgi:diacylglycerol O-acyltransferase / wax synthase